MLWFWPSDSSLVDIRYETAAASNIRDTTWVQRRLVDVCRSHVLDRSLERGRVKVVVLLLLDLLTNKVLFKSRSKRSRDNGRGRSGE